METTIVKNRNKDLYEEATKAVKENDGYCPCALEKTPDTKCMCKEFRDSNEIGECHCGRFERIYLTDYKNENEVK